MIEAFNIEFFRRELIFLFEYFSLLVSQIAPYWIFGMALGSCVSVFGKGKLRVMFSALRGKKLGALGLLPAALIGIASPLCMFGTIPICASLANEGMEEDYLAAFMMSSILLNPQILFFSAALGNAALAIRFISCLLCGITAGLLIRFFWVNKRPVANIVANNNGGVANFVAKSGKKFFDFSRFTETASRDTDPNIIFRFLKNLLRNIKATGPAFLMGICIAVLFQRYVPANAVAALFGRQRGFGLLMAASVGVPLYFCGGGTIPLLIAWMHYGMSLGAAAAFMITGPAMKITNLGALKIVLGAKHFAIYIVFSVLFALATGMVIDLVANIS
jgi:uncharacterized membrane protein YraQ (UPF0718 family)